jgi:hypothetical protein
MRCFRHQEREAIGICKHCQRGLCPDCAALVDSVLACRDLHEAQVAALNRATAIDAIQSGRVRSGYVRNAIFYGLVGAIFAALGISQLRFLGLQAAFFIVVGGLLLYAASANYLESRRFL